MKRFLRQYLPFVILSILFLDLLKVMYDFSIVIFYELSHPYAGDAHFFYTIGHGILKGFLPYIDLFETKPPGIFLLSAASLYFTQGTTLGDTMEALAIIIPPLLFIGAYYQATKMPKNIYQWILGISAILYFFILATFVGYTSGAYHTETFGVLFVSIYCLLILFLSPEKIFSQIAFSLSLFFAIFFKEPFIFTAIACALILSKNVLHFFRICILPSIIAVLLGIITLKALGYWDGYVYVYLEEILHSRIGVFQPSWMSILGIWMPFFGPKSIFIFSSSLSVFLIIFVLLLPSVIHEREWKKEGVIIHGCSMSAIALAFLLAIILLQQRYYNPPLFVFPILLTLFYLLYEVIHGWIYALDRSTFILHWLQIVLSIFAINLAVGSGGDYSPHQFSISIPYFAVIGLLLFQDLFIQCLSYENTSKRRHYLYLALIILLCIASLQISTKPLLNRLMIEKTEQEKTEEVSQMLDAILYTCNEERYLIVGDAPSEKIWRFTKHVPLGPGFFQYQLNYPTSWRKPPLYFMQKFADNLGKNTNILVRLPASAHQREIPSEIWKFVDKTFTRTPWKCAEKLPTPKTFEILYRIDRITP